MAITIGLSQMNSRDNKLENLAAAEKSIQDLAAQGARLIMLPENFNFMGPQALK